MESKRARVGSSGDGSLESDRIERNPPAADAEAEVSFEARVPKVARSPGEPTAAERKRHNVTHCPYRSWCRACVLGRGKDRHHRRVDRRADTVPRVAMDYMFLTSYGFTTSGAAAEEMIRRANGTCRTVLTVLVLKDCMHGSIWAYPVRGKGLEASPEVIDHILGDLDACGFDNARLIIKNDQEVAIKEVQAELRRRRSALQEAGTAVEHSRVGDSASNGRVERCIQELGGQVRTLRVALEERLRTTIPLSHPIVPWLIRHSADILNKCQVREEGKTSFELIKGRACIEPLAEFGEYVYFKPLKTNKEALHKDSWRDRFTEGFWIGALFKSSENLVITATGVHKAGAIRCRPSDEQWSPTLLDEKLYEITPTYDMDIHKIPSYVRPELDGDPPPVRPEDFVEPPEAPRPAVRQLSVKDIYVRRHGPSPGCAKCIAIQENRACTRPHSQKCRDRFIEILRGTADGAARVARAEARLVEETYRQSIDAEPKRQRVEHEKPEWFIGDEIEWNDLGGPRGLVTDKEQYRMNRPGYMARRRLRNRENPIGAPFATAEQASQAQRPDRPARPDPASVPVPEESSPRQEPEPASSSGMPAEARRKRANSRSVEDVDPREAKAQAEEIRGTLSVDIDSVPVDKAPRSCLKPSQFGLQDDHDGCQEIAEIDAEKKLEPVEYDWNDLRWREIGSGAWARTFVNATRLITTTKGGPCREDVFRHIVRCARTGAVLDDCTLDDVPDKDLYRPLDRPQDIIVELIMRNAAKWFRQKGPDVAEVYSPPRVVREAGVRLYGGKRLHPGLSLDLTTVDPETGQPWDLSDGKTRTKVVELIREGKPYCLILSPMCTAFSSMQNINRDRRDPGIVTSELEEAKDHVRWCMKLCALQARSNRYFVYEHPAGATSWSMAEVKKVAAMEGTRQVRFDQCMFGLQLRDEKSGEMKPVRKRTIMMTNSPEVARRLDRQCPNSCANCEKKHDHLQLEGGNRCKRAQVYPRELCRTICSGVAAQKRCDAMNLVALDVLSVEELMALGDDELHDSFDKQHVAVDDVSGGPLVPHLVRNARREELEYFKTMNVYEHVPLRECISTTGKPPIGTRWIDTNKGDAESPNYRSRLVAKEYRVTVDPELFAATPPVECLRLLLSKAAESKKHKILYVDVSRAYFYAKSVRPTYIKLPAEDPRAGDPTVCGKLLFSMYGTRDAAQNWSREYSATLAKAGYKRGIANPCLFVNASEKVSLMVHGDDFVAVGPEAGVRKLHEALEKAYKVKAQVMGNDDGDDRELRVLNRVIRLDEKGYRLEADPRHAEQVIRDLGLEGASGSRLPGSKDCRSPIADGDDIDAEQDAQALVGAANTVRASTPPREQENPPRGFVVLRAGRPSACFQRWKQTIPILVSLRFAYNTSCCTSLRSDTV